jgi:hypothetical protein
MEFYRLYLNLDHYDKTYIPILSQNINTYGYYIEITNKSITNQIPKRS